MRSDDEGSGTRWAALAMIVGAAMVAVYFSGDDHASMAERIEASAHESRRRDNRRRGRGLAPARDSSRSGVHARRNHHIPHEGEVDPQEQAYRRSFSSVPDAGALPPFVPSLHVGRLASTTGDSPAQPGARCEVRVLPVATAVFNCLVRVMCDGVVLYPDGAQAAGYAPCSVEGGLVTQADDEAITSADGDPAMHVDLAERHVRVMDDGPMGRRFSATIELRPI